MTATWENVQDSYRAASVRVALGLFSAVALPWLTPGLAPQWPVLVAYLVAVIVLLVLVRKGRGGVWRVLAGGVIDLAYLTFLVHQLGTVSTGLVSLYVLVGMLNAIVAPRWCAALLAGLGALAYSAVIFVEATGGLPYAPAIPKYADLGPSLGDAARSSLLLAVLVAVSTLVAERIARALHSRETELRRANEQLQQISERDPLTQLYNRRFFVQRVEQELERVRRGHPMALLMIDLDRFKHINDEQGHLAGDELLRQIAAAVEECIRAVDAAGRFGGDEFVVMLSDTSAEEADIVAGRLLERIRRLGARFDAHNPVTASIGIALARAEDDVVVLLNTADESAYRAKQAGGDRYMAKDPARNSAQFESGPRTAQTG